MRKISKRIRPLPLPTSGFTLAKTGDSMRTKSSRASTRITSSFVPAPFAVGMLESSTTSSPVTTLRNTTVSGNSADTTGLSGFARGGGIFDIDESPDGPSGGPLTLINSSVTGNALSGSAGTSLLGGGIYSTNPVFLTNSLIANNVPDECFGC